MSESVQLALIQNLPAILAAVAAIVGAIVSLQVKAGQTVTHTIINGRMTQLLEQTGAAARAEGKIEAQQSIEDKK